MKIKNEADLLNKFCDKTHIKKKYTEPFFNVKYGEVWSTDGFSLIQINTKVLVNKYPEEIVSLPVLECPCKKGITIEAINKALDTCPKFEEEIVLQDAVECEDCNGTGEVNWEFTDNGGFTHRFEYDCPVCDGSGIFENEKTKKTGKFSTKENAIINIGNAYFYANTIIKLKFAMDFLRITSVELTHNSERGGNQFVLNDDVRITLMAILHDPLFPCDATVELIE